MHTSDNKSIMYATRSMINKDISVRGLNNRDTNNPTVIESSDRFKCCIYNTPRTFDWCKLNCNCYYRCDTFTLAGDELNENKISNIQCSIQNNQDIGLSRRFKVIITETLEHTIDIEVENQYEAEQIISDKWKNGEYILGSENFVDVKFKAFSVDG